MTTKVKPSVLADTAVTTGTYGGYTTSDIKIPVITVDQQGRLTSAANASLVITPQLVTNNQYYQITSNTANGLASGSWTVVQAGTKLNFIYGGTTVFSIDSSGNIVAKADITGFGTP